MVVIEAHVIQRTLGDEAQLALVVADELVAPVLKIHEAVIGLGQDLPQQLLVGQAIVVIDQIVQQVIKVHVGLLDDHVAARKAAKAAPVTGALVHHQHVVKKILGAHGRPHATEPHPTTSRSVVYSYPLGSFMMSSGS